MQRHSAEMHVPSFKTELLCKFSSSDCVGITCLKLKYQQQKLSYIYRYLFILVSVAAISSDGLELLISSLLVAIDKLSGRKPFDFSTRNAAIHRFYPTHRPVRTIAKRKSLPNGFRLCVAKKGRLSLSWNAERENELKKKLE